MGDFSTVCNILMILLQSEFFVQQFEEKRKQIFQVFFQAIILALTLTKGLLHSLVLFLYTHYTVAYPSMKLILGLLLSFSKVLSISPLFLLTILKLGLMR